MNELDKGTKSHKTLKLKLNDLLQLNTETTIPKFLTRIYRDYNNEEVPVSSNVKKKQIRKGEDRMNLEEFVPFFNQTRTEEGRGISAVKVSLQAVGIIVIVMMIASCCCTLYLRNRLMALVHKITRKKTKESMLLPVDIEKGKGESKNSLSSSLKKLQKTETKMPGNDATRTATRSFMTTTSSVQAEPSSTTCCKCFKKKRKKVRRKRKK